MKRKRGNRTSRMIVKLFACSLIGLSNGLIVGGGIVAFLTVLNIISRLAHLTRTWNYIGLYGWSITTGAFFSTIMSLLDFHFHLPTIVVSIIGILMGLFVGMLASALAEVLDVIPISADRIRVSHYVRLFIFILAFGKVIGSLVFWLTPLLQ